jgi:threonine aldolase
MLSIGDFARHGRISVRMLRHYDTIGLLRPAFVDQETGYRSYDAGQLSRLNRIVALKGLVHLQERFWATSCSAAYELAERTTRSLVKDHKASLSIAQKVS